MRAAKPSSKAKRRPAAALVLKSFRDFLLHYSWWEGAILLIGTISFIAVVVTLLLPIGSGPTNLAASSAMPAAGSPAFLRNISNALTLPVEHGGPVEIINNGDTFLKALLPDIDAAKSSINFMVYIWEDGKMSDMVLDHLDAKLKQGVPVRVVLDAYGGATAPSGKFKRFQELGGKVSTFHSLIPLPWTLSREHKRNHRRAIVIDGKVGYTGGIAVADSWLGNARNSREWRDLMFRVHGGMAQHLQGAFAELWTSMTGEILTGDKFYPIADSPSSSTLTYVPLASSPSPDLYEMQNFILLSLLSARHRIYITTPYFLPDESVVQALISRARAGADVRVLVPNAFNDNQSVRHASQYSYEELLRGGVRIYEFQPTFIHTKLIIVDGVWSVIGSANMDNRSRKLNDEIALGISDPSFARALETVYAADLTRAKEIRLVDWEKRGFWQRAREIFARKFIQQY